jgi:hypothetical protein
VVIPATICRQAKHHIDNAISSLNFSQGISAVLAGRIWCVKEDDSSRDDHDKANRKTRQSAEGQLSQLSRAALYELAESQPRSLRRPFALVLEATSLFPCRNSSIRPVGFLLLGRSVYRSTFLKLIRFRQIIFLDPRLSPPPPRKPPTFDSVCPLTLRIPQKVNRAVRDLKSRLVQDNCRELIVSIAI